MAYEEGVGAAEFNHEPLLNMLVVINAEAPACYAISGIPALPTSTSGFFGCGTENSALLSEFKIPDDPIFHVCSLHQQWKRLHVTRPLSSQPLVFLCCSFEYCWVDITMLTTEHSYVSGGAHAAFLSLGFLFFLPTRTLTEALCCDIDLVSSGQMHQWHVQHQNARSQYNQANTALVSNAAQFVY